MSEQIVSPGAAEFDRLPDSAFIGVRAVAQVFGISVPSAWRWSRDGALPKPVRLSAGSTRWRVGDLRKRLAELSEAA
ncbi:MAG: hypothetical protein OJF60_002531 [Burkholderiaceae bacterium]|jgi:predicted DNA-binding transcriptional regulator AlpA|nr:MAG: hypothetical protein OJF60_002531 [Burkholderiaceae bacterium]